jgi:hypothetical protein
MHHMQTTEENDMQKSPEPGMIELRVRDLSDLLVTASPPFKGAALAPDAASYIVRKAKQVPAREPIHLLIESAEPLGRDVGPIVAAYFREAATAESQDMRELFRSGRKALLIGLITLSLCLFLAWYFTYEVEQRPITRLIQESFVILGWVSMWKPIEIFLYEWLPFARRRKLFLRLSSANVTSTFAETPRRR